MLTTTLLDLNATVTRGHDSTVQCSNELITHYNDILETSGSAGLPTTACRSCSAPAARASCT